MLLFVLLLTACSESPMPAAVFDHGTESEIAVKEHLAFNPIQNLSEFFKWEVTLLDSTFDFNLFESFSAQYSEDTLSVFCFRGNNFRNAPSRGHVTGKPVRVELDWNFRTHYDTTKTKYGVWGGGSGWTGQPLIVNWSRAQKTQLGINDPAFVANDDALEVIVGSLSGNIYFINLETGDSTRGHLSIDGPIKGTPSVDPRKNGLLYVGQGVGRTGRFGAYVFDMFQHKEIFYQPGADYSAHCFWGAFDSNPLIDYKSGMAFWPAENGQIYTIASAIEPALKVVRKYKYTSEKTTRNGIESSMAAIDHYGIYADNDGNIVCVDLISMTPQWHTFNYDDTDASIVVDEEKDHYAIYVGNEVDKRGDSASASLRKLDAATGKEIWHVERTCYGTELSGKTNSGGMLATPTVGKGNSSDLVFGIFSRTNKMNRGELVAVDKKTGKERYSITLDAYSWASPVDFYDEHGNLYLFLTDVWGTVYLVEGKTGTVLFKERFGYTFESSPVIVNDRIVLGARGKSILSFKIVTE